MKVSSGFSHALVCAAALCAVSADFLASSSLPAYPDFIQFDSAPDSVTPQFTAQVSFLCSTLCRVGIELAISTATSNEVVTFRRTWIHLRKTGSTRTRRVRLVFPPTLLYKRDFMLRRAMDASDVMLRAWLIHLDEETSEKKHDSQYHQSAVRTFKLVRNIPLSERPARPRRESADWGSELMWNLRKDKIQQCRVESDLVDLLIFPFASTGEKYGVVRTFSAFFNRNLERVRLRALDNPRLTLSVWLYLLDRCSQTLCSIIQRVNADKTYGTPLVMLSRAGDIIVQVQLASGGESAFRAHVALPVLTWIRLDLFMHNSQARLLITLVDTGGAVSEATHTYKFQSAVFHDDTSGYFTVGGSVYLPGIHGYFGPAKYYRLGSEQVVNPLSPARTLTMLDGAHRQCERMEAVTVEFLHALRDGTTGPANDVCESYYEEMRRTFGRAECVQTWTWDENVTYRTALTTLKTHEQELVSDPRNARLHLSQQLYQDAVRRLPGTRPGSEVMTSLVELLQLSSCWGHQQAALLLATLNLAGIAVPPDREQGHTYSLMGALGDRRLSLLHLGYKHMQGLDGFPQDQDVAYGYYANVGRQTSADHGRVHDSEQSLSEHVHLSSSEEMQTQTGETGDVGQFLRHQAERGDLESQKTLARMLFWGSNGVKKDISEAVRWYSRCALQMSDATAMYDYGILLLKGTGVKMNRTLGLRLLKKAAEMGSVEALNGLGWYYSTVSRNDRKAVRYFQQAAANGSRDGVFNLGVYHLYGTMPNSPGKNETAAFHCFLKAGQLGHVEGAVEAAATLSKGMLPGVRRDPEKAVILLKQISERNGHLGFNTREALQTFQQGSWDEALLKYAMLAETGLVVAQNNAAHLCEVLKHGSGCHWRYHNYSTHNHLPHKSGLLKMGDRHMAEGDVETAISLYSRAALLGSPKGAYNLAVLMDEGHSVPGNVLEQMQISAEMQKDKAEVVETLLLRCRQVEGEKEDLTPCSLALFWIQLGKAWRGFQRSSTQLVLAASAVSALIAFVLALVVRTVVAHYSASLASSPSNQPQRSPNESDSLNQVTNGRVQNGASYEAGPRLSSRSSEISEQQSRNQNSRLLEETVDLVITATGVCVCAICTMFVSHLL